jgi:membrane fusion protein (multidrug efflux system)
MDTERQHPRFFTAGPRRCDKPSHNLRAALALLAACCGCAGEAPPRVAPSLPPTVVRVAKADRSLRPVLTEVVGTVRAVHDATIAPLVSGTVTEVRVGLGSAVRAGEVLVRLSARDVDARLAQTRAVSALATRERERASILKDQGAITVAHYEAALSQFSVAQAQQAEASTVADRTVLRAPFAGVITSKLVNVGDTALPGRPLLTLESRAALRFEAQVPESASEQLAIGQPLQVRLEGLERPLEGRIAEIQPASDDATRARLVKIELGQTQGLRSGQFGRALLAAGQAVTVTVPAGSVVRHGQLEAVFIVEAGTAHLRLVRCGRELDGSVQIAAGLSGGEQVALGADLMDGQRVEAAR